MEFSHFNFYKNRIGINFLAKDADNAKSVLEEMEGNAVIGILSKQFKTIEEGITYVRKFQEEIPFLSIGLGDGDPKQWKMAAEIAAATDPGHLNQVFSSAGYAMGLLRGKGCSKTIVNALISPTGQLGKVKISTGPYSSHCKDVIVDIETAIAMLKDVGIQSIKYFHIKGDQTLEELKIVVEACAKMDMPMIEPTGGITVENIKPILKVCIQAGCKKIMPHVYSSVIDRKTGLTDKALVKMIFHQIKEVI